MCFRFLRMNEWSGLNQIVVLRTLWLTWLAIINVFIVVLDELTWWLVSNIVPGRDRFPVVDDTCEALSPGFKQSKSTLTLYNKWFYHFIILSFLLTIFTSRPISGPSPIYIFTKKNLPDCYLTAKSVWSDASTIVRPRTWSPDIRIPAFG